MSAWMHVEGHIETSAPHDEVERALAVGLPEGSEGPVAPISPCRAVKAWLFSDDLRDMDESDVPEVRDWFCNAVAALGDTVTEAELVLSGYRWLFVFRLDGDGVVRLVVPPLYVEAVARTTDPKEQR